MDVVNEVINGSNFMKASGVIFISTITYSIVHLIYDTLTKSDIEKCLTYRGKDRILSSFLMFIMIVLITVIFTFTQLVEANNESGLLFSIILVLAVSMILFIVSMSILVIAHLIFIVMKLYPIYEVKIDDKKEEYWRIFKVTKNNNVILQNKNMYLSLSSVKELDNKIIRVQDNKKKQKNRKRK